MLTTCWQSPLTALIGCRSLGLQVIIWVLGEYGAAYCPQGAGGVIPKLVGVLNGHAISDSTRGYLLAALGKICCQTGSSLSKEAEAFVRSAASSRNADVQQRALEIQALWSSDRLTQTVALPKDAACEDPEVCRKCPPSAAASDHVALSVCFPAILTLLDTLSCSCIVGQKQRWWHSPVLVPVSFHLPPDPALPHLQG